MSIVTFPSMWGEYTVTQATLCQEPYMYSTANRRSQNYIYFETASNSETVQIVTNCIYEDTETGECTTRSGWGTRKCVLKPKAREIWKMYRANGYSLDVKKINGKELE